MQLDPSTNAMQKNAKKAKMQKKCKKSTNSKEISIRPQVALKKSLSPAPFRLLPRLPPPPPPALTSLPSPFYFPLLVVINMWRENKQCNDVLLGHSN